MVQLRQDNPEGTLYNLVGFQTKLKWKEQERIFRLIPGLEKAEFARLGSIHRNTFVNGPEVLWPTLQLKRGRRFFWPVRSPEWKGTWNRRPWGSWPGSTPAVSPDKPLVVPPRTTAMGALAAISPARAKEFSAHECPFRTFPPFERGGPRRFRGKAHAERAMADLKAWMAAEELD